MRALTLMLSLVMLSILGAISALFVGPATLRVDAPTLGPDGTAQVGTEFPALRGYDYSNRGRVVEHPAIILVGSHWCEHCKKEVSALAAANREQLPFGNIYFISTWQVWPFDWPPEKSLDLESFPGETIVDTESKVARDLGVQEIPTWIITDEDGVVVDRTSGELSLQDLLVRAESARKEKE